MKKILCFGDSNTYGFDPKDGSRFNEKIRWSGRLANLLGCEYSIIEAGCNNRTCFSDNDGIFELTGYKAITKYLDGNYFLIVIAIGINDLQKFYNPKESEIKKGLDEFLNLVRKKQPNTKILLAAPSKLNNNVLTHQYFSLQFDEESVKKSLLLPSIYENAAKKFNCSYIDLNTLSEVSNIDGLHFSEEGHKKIADKLYEFILSRS